MSRTISRLVLVAAVLAALPAFGQDDFYIVGERRVPLTPSATSRAVRVVDGQMPAFAEAVARSSSVRIVPLPAVEERYGVVFLRAAEGAIDDVFEREATALMDDPAVQAPVPVYRTGEMEMLLVDEFVVRFESDVSLDDARAVLVDELEARILSTDERRRRFTISFPGVAAEVALRRVNALAADPRVRNAQPEFVRIHPPRLGRLDEFVPTPALRAAIERMRGDALLDSEGYCPAPVPGTTPVDSPNDDLFPQQWSLENIASSASRGIAGADIGAVAAWQVTLGAPEVTIAVVDLGVQSDHVDLAAKIVPGVDVTGAGDTDPQHPDDDHGTAVAGVAAAVSDNDEGIAGVDWSAKIAPVRFASSGCPSGDCGWVTFGGGARAGIEEATALGARVIINSWDWSSGDGPDGELEDALREAVAAGAVVVFAAGQHIPETCPGTESRAVAYPARLAGSEDETLSAGVIAVSATNAWDEFKTHFCDDEPSQDLEVFWGSNRGPEISLSAPGTGIWSTDADGGYGCFGGTSMAAPLVGGAAALLFAVHPEATPAQVKHWLQEGAEYLGNSPEGRDDRYGHGRLDIAGALQVAAEETSSSASPPTANGEPEGVVSQKVETPRGSYRFGTMHIVGLGLALVAGAVALGALGWLRKRSRMES